MRLIDADDLLAKVQENAPGFMDSGSTITKAFIMAMINTKSVAPTIDAVPVVRCKDCKWWDKKDGSNYGYCHACKQGYSSDHWEIGIYRTYKGDWFCADGEMKE